MHVAAFDLWRIYVKVNSGSIVSEYNAYFNLNESLQRLD